jgi:hypothetical protein
LKAIESSPFLRPPLSALQVLFPNLNFSDLNEKSLNAQLLVAIQDTAQKIIADKTLDDHAVEQATTQQEREGKLSSLTPKKSFICQSSLPNNDTRYYEQIIFEDDIIPTRAESWHDFFNGIIWLRFPQTKAYLNQMHISEINAHGLNPRTKVRNHITHFDECGIVLYIHGADLFSHCEDLLENQLWTGLFCGLHAEWHNSIHPVIFGHANLEMLLKPFIGLTGKVLLIQIDELPSNGRMLDSEFADTSLVAHLRQNKTMYKTKPFYPLPILGVPRWHYEQQDSDFYSNTQYFMPKRR